MEQKPKPSVEQANSSEATPKQKDASITTESLPATKNHAESEPTEFVPTFTNVTEQYLGKGIGIIGAGSAEIKSHSAGPKFLYFTASTYTYTHRAARYYWPKGLELAETLLQLNLFFSIGDAPVPMVMPGPDWRTTS